MQPHGADITAWRPVSWAVLGAATLVLLVLAVATVAHAFLRPRPTV